MKGVDCSYKSRHEDYTLKIKNMEEKIMRNLFYTVSILLIFILVAGQTGAAVIDFDGGIATLSDGSTVVTDNDHTYWDVDYYEENGFRLDFVGDYGIIGNYYGPDTTGNNNAVIHGHWAVGHYGNLSSIVITKTDNTPFDLNYFILASNTDMGGWYASGNEQAWITSSDGYSVQLPSQDWGWDVTGPYPGVGNLGVDQIFIDSHFDNITSFTFTVTNVVDCFGMDEFYIDEDAPPPIEAPTADPGGPYMGPLEICFDGTGSFDPDGDPLTYSWDFGDGNIGTGATPCHTYAEAGIYDVCLIVNDGTSDSQMACTSAVIYDPNAGFVTGGGWIYSAEGCYFIDPSLTGRANFGFVSKYKKGAEVPTGQTEFQFHTASLDFHSDNYQWLVVTGGNSARFKGEGTINGENDANGNLYKFLIWAQDNTTDTFRIKIWSEDEAGIETVVYDNGFDQEIDGGQIIVHTAKN